MDAPSPSRRNPPPALTPGARVDRYRIVRPVGRGAMGTIYLAHDTVLDRTVALKTLPDTLRTHPEHRERFLREAKAAAKIRHPNVVAVHDVCLSAPPFIVMEYLEGETLEACLRREAPMALDQALALLLPVASALMAAHEAGVVHRDLKPANVMLVRERDGSLTPKVLDFGISKLHPMDREPCATAARSPDLTARDALLGTPNYMAPEQDGAHDAVGPWSDTYALALVLYRAVTGRLPFPGAHAQEVLYRKRVGHFTAPSTFPFGLPDGLDRWMQRALHSDPKARFSTMRELGMELLAFLPEMQRARWEAVFAPPEDVVRDAAAPAPLEALREPETPSGAPADDTASVVVEFTATRTGAVPGLDASWRRRVLLAALAGVCLIVLVQRFFPWGRPPASSPRASVAPSPLPERRLPAPFPTPDRASSPMRGPGPIPIMMAAPGVPSRTTSASPQPAPPPAPRLHFARARLPRGEARGAMVPLGQGEFVTNPLRMERTR